MIFYFGLIICPPLRPALYPPLDNNILIVVISVASCLQQMRPAYCPTNSCLRNMHTKILLFIVAIL